MANSVQTNISAINANRNFGITKGTLKSSTEKLSSGFKINRAADDAAGLAISEKMRRQIRGLTQASANAQDGISSVQTAEGALTEVHAMLQRMDELATKAANGSNSKDDRQFVQDELDQLMTEIDRVAETTKFNETYLLKGGADKSETSKTLVAKDAGLAGTLVANDDGKTSTFTLDKPITVGSKINIAGKEYEIVADNAASYAQVSSSIKTATGETVTDSLGNTREVVDSVTDSATQVASGTVYAPGDIKNKGQASETIYTAYAPKTLEDDITQTGSIKNTLWQQVSAAASTTATVSVTHAGDTQPTVYTLANETNEDNISVEDLFNKLQNGDTFVVGSNSYSVVGYDKANDDVSKITEKQANGLIQNALIEANSIGADKETTVSSDGGGKFTITQGTVTVKKALEFNLHVGADADMTNKIGVKIDAMDTKGLGISGLNVVDDSGTKATYALDSIEAAIKTVSQQRSALGAAQNRLEHTIKNVDNVVENTTSAESAIRDTDMATEMVKFSNANILAQAGQSMLAQANQQNQGILSLLG